jgi:hypothetical protein
MMGNRLIEREGGGGGGGGKIYKRGVHHACKVIGPRVNNLNYNT